MRSRLLPTFSKSATSLLRPRAFGLVSMRLQSTTAIKQDAIVNEPKEKKPMTIDRELPDPFKDRTRNRVQFIGFWILMGVSAALMFNYEKMSSPVVTTTLHFLRRSAIIRDVLGDEIDFKTAYPWISGELNQVKGAVNIKFDVKGSKHWGTIRLVADRKSRRDEFLIHEWSLEVEGKKYDLLADESVDFSVSWGKKLVWNVLM